MSDEGILQRADALLAAGNRAAAVEIVSSAATSGNAASLRQMALWHVYGDPLPRDFAAARRLFERGGAAGDREAARIHAVFMALGAGGPGDWGEAVSLLRKAAALDPVAAAQCALLGSMALSANGDPASAASIRPIAESPRLGIVRGLCTPAECVHIAAVAAPRMVPSMVTDPRTGRLIPHPIRTSEGAVLGPIQQDLVVEAINRRIAAASGTRVEQGEPLTVLRYAPGQEYRLHHDCLPGERNQRVVTAILYLNDGYGGGATAFPAAGCEVQGRTGDLVVFGNTLPDGHVDERSRHAGLPVTRGEKWVATRWIRQHDFDPWGMRPR